MSAIEPYGNSAADLMYNLLFCDDPALFGQAAPASDLAIVLSDGSGEDQVRAIAKDPRRESRVRALAYNWLRRHGAAVPAKVLLGTIVEVPLERGLDTLAAFGDSSVRYINQTGKIAVFEPALPNMKPPLAELFSSAQRLVDKIGPWDKPRLPPPPQGAVRMSFLVSDGLYFGQAKFADLARDALGGPVIKHATELLALVADLPNGRSRG
jgi:hypothetical protein